MGMRIDGVQLTEREWGIIERVPNVVFCYIAGADGKISRAEIDAFKEGWIQEELSNKFSKNRARNEYIRGVFQQAAEDTRRRIISAKAIMGLLQKFVEILKKLPKMERALLKRSIRRLAKSVAEASRDLLYRKISPDEETALIQVQAALA